MATSGNEADSSSQDHFDTLNNNDSVESLEAGEPSINKGKERVEEELDFEEGSVGSGDNNKVDCLDESEQNPQTDEPSKELDEGQVNSDDDLEEGEVVDDDDDEPTASKKDPCRFFSKGQCTWGDSCRFSHDSAIANKSPASANITPMGPLPQKIPFEPLPLPPMPLYPHPGLLPPPPLPRPMQESGWERGLKTAHERVVRANERKEKDVDFNEKRLNLGVEDDDGYRSSKHHYSSREGFYASHDRRSPHGHSSSNLYSKYAEQYYSESSRGTRYQDVVPREERYPRDRRDRESEYERRQRLALESAPKEWQEDRRRQYDHPRPSGKNPDVRRPDEYVDPYKRSPNPRVSSHHDGNRSPYSSFSDTSGSGLSSSEFSDSDSDSWSDHGEPKERSKKRKDYKTKSYSSATAPKLAPGAPPNPLAKRIPKISQRKRVEEAQTATHHSPRSSYPYDDRPDDRHEPERVNRHRDIGDPYTRSRSRSQKGGSISPELERPTRVSRDEEDAPYRKKRRSGQSPHNFAVSKEPSFSMNMKGKFKPALTSRAFPEDDEDDERNVASPKDENSLSPGFDQMSPKQQIAHLSEKTGTSQRRKALLEQLRAVEAAIAKKKKN